MTTRTTVSLVSVILKIFEQDRPEGFPTSIDRGLRQMRLEHAVSVLLDFQELSFTVMDDRFSQIDWRPKQLASYSSGAN